MEMEDQATLQDRRNSIRFNLIHPVIYARFDDQGRPFEEKPSKSINISLGGVRLESGLAVDSGEILEITVALPDRLVTMLGKVVYVTQSEDQVFEFGISTQRIEYESMTPLVHYLQRILTSGPIRIGPSQKGIRVMGHDRAIRKGDRILCPHCGEQIGSLNRINDMITYCKEFYGQCRCGQKYTIKLSLSNTTVLSFPDSQIEIAC
jgi:hypothetical protein